MKITTLTTSFNRKNKTLRALQDLHKQIIPVGIHLEHFLVDDGSWDGTAEEISRKFPDVRVIRGTGALYWAGGMRFGWERLSSDLNYDYLLVYNDDINLYQDALFRLIKTSYIFQSTGGPKAHAIVGSFLDRSLSQVTYGGLQRDNKLNLLSFQRVTPDLSQPRKVG